MPRPVLRFVSFTERPWTVMAREEEPQRWEVPGRDTLGRRWRVEGEGGRVIRVTGLDVPAGVWRMEADMGDKLGLGIGQLVSQLAGKLVRWLASQLVCQLAKH
jgi:hypothetical protein